ncbi:MAG: sigma-54-dependent transcriptional regulator [Phycisphaerae bacterium]
MARVCVVDDKAILRDSLAETLAREDHAVTVYDDPGRALADIKRHSHDLVLTDLKMPGMDGLALIRQVRDAGCDVPIIMMTAYATVGTAVEALKLGAYDYIQKPFAADEVAAVVDRALEHARLRKDNEALLSSIDDLRGVTSAGASRRLVGCSAAMVALRGQLDRFAQSHATVLITGESGTGKELAAWYIHRASPRADRPMLCLNCAALSANLLESELFGHDRGAFTGADRTRKGRFEMADGGTLLLDEVSEMALPLQAKLLRVLQEGEFERVGSSMTRRADVRVIATTNRDLHHAVAKDGTTGSGGFRADLYYRLNVLPVTMPPLREHPEDIAELAGYFLERAAKRDGSAPPKPTPDAVRRLTDYAWPGNIRELENICRRAVTLCTDGVITAALLEPWLTTPTAPLDGLGALRDGMLLEDMERRLIERTLARFNGHRVNSARALGMGVRTLGMKLKQWREEAAEREHLVGAGGTA